MDDPIRHSWPLLLVDNIWATAQPASHILFVWCYWCYTFRGLLASMGFYSLSLISSNHMKWFSLKIRLVVLLRMLQLYIWGVQHNTSVPFRFTPFHSGDKFPPVGMAIFIALLSLKHQYVAFSATMKCWIRYRTHVIYRNSLSNTNRWNSNKPLFRYGVQLSKLMQSETIWMHAMHYLHYAVHGRTLILIQPLRSVHLWNFPYMVI